MTEQTATGGVQLLLVDDHTLVRESLRRLLESAPDQWCVTEAGNGFQAMDLVRRQAFELVVTDLCMPGMGGLELIRRIRHAWPALPVLVLTMHAEEQYAIRALQAGANGYMTKDSPASALLDAARKVATGGAYLPPAVANRVLWQIRASTPPLDIASLSNRELDIMQRIVNGQRPVDIANALHLSIKTVSSHKRHIQQKLSLSSTAAIVRFGLEHQLVPSAV
jgi:DNA-binding NarL/FixJ family response regulator